MDMAVTTGILAILYFLLVLGIGVYILVLLARFVKAHQRGSEALEVIARKLQDGTRPH